MAQSPADVLAYNRQQALELASKLGAQKTRKLLEKAQADLAARLQQAIGLNGPGKDSFTAIQLELALRQLRFVTKDIVRGMKGLVVEQALTAADKATGDLLKYMGTAHRSFGGLASQPLAIKEASMLEQAQAGARASVLRRLAVSGEEGAAEENAQAHRAKPGILERYGIETITSFEETLQVGLLAKKSWAEVRDDVTGASEFLQQKPRFWAERIVRTETMGAYNRAGWEAMRSADKQLGDMVKILCATFDDRTEWDSFSVHGQIRLPEQAFQWRDGLFQHPPNRPNDREVVVPHRKAWPIPENLRWRSDEEVAARYRLKHKNGSPGPRPKMTTVPLSEFGK